MKKILMFLILSFIFISNVEAKEVVTLNKCVDGDTAWFNTNTEVIKARFLAIDTPESTNKIERLGKEASNFTCESLTKAKKIEIEYDENSDKLDKYERHLVWVFVDDVLLQDLIIKNGLAEIDYLYGEYKYTNILKESEILAKQNNLGIWQDYNYNLYLILAIIFIIIVIIGCCMNKKIRKKVFNKIKGKTKKEIKKYMKSI